MNVKDSLVRVVHGLMIFWWLQDYQLSEQRGENDSSLLMIVSTYFSLFQHASEAMKNDDPGQEIKSRCFSIASVLTNSADSLVERFSTKSYTHSHSFVHDCATVWKLSQSQSSGGVFNRCKTENINEQILDSFKSIRL